MEKENGYEYISALQQKIKRVIADSKSNKNNIKKKIQDAIDDTITEFAKDRHSSLAITYASEIHRYLMDKIIRLNYENGKRALELFKDDIEEIQGAYYTLIFEGLYDLVLSDKMEAHHRKYIKGFKFYLPKLQLEWVKEINSHAKYRMPVLIIGETGTSKEFVARSIHKLSNRKGIFLAINCAAIPENLLESELFGHERGAFTGASRTKIGDFELADDGTVFLDEIGKMQSYQQAKLLRTIEEKEIKRIGGNKSIKIDVRFIAAIQPKDIDENTILPDLKYRLGYPYVITMPTLKERFSKLDGRMAGHILRNSLGLVLKEINVRDSMEISKDTLNLLVNHEYKGNYRELESILMAAVISAKNNDRTEIQSEDICLIANKSMAVKEEPSRTDIQDIKFRDIFVHADKVRASIVEEKICELLGDGIDFKAALKKEGIPQKEYIKYIRKVNKYTGKGIRDIENN